MSAISPKSVLVLGSTGSIGTSTLSVIENMPERLRVAGLSAGSRWEVLARQAEKFGAPAVAVADGANADALRRAVGPEVEVYAGTAGILELVATVEADVVVGGITGWAGFRPALRALELGRDLALANKETLVVGGELVRELTESGNGEILPVDSEQSALFQAMCCGRPTEVRRVIVTASGGPFHGMSREEREKVTPSDALRHPNWDMGRKITIDSATMMNKALETIETRWLFDLPAEKIDVLIHPQSIIHTMEQFVDG
jgi:1-deoxy-D-xylulose-5-phosphate reductoisomerase